MMPLVEKFVGGVTRYIHYRRHCYFCKVALSHPSAMSWICCEGRYQERIQTGADCPTRIEHPNFVGTAGLLTG